LPEVLRLPVSDGVATLVAPTPVLDPATAAVLEQAVADAERRAFAAGERAGREAAVEAATRAAAAVGQALDVLHAEVIAQRAATCAADLDLAVALASEVLGRSPADDAVAVLDRVRDAVAMLDDDPLEVRLHPEDHAALAAVRRDRACSWSPIRASPPGRPAWSVPGAAPN
jgi:flagellar biosynthesis/type III secretory pathway protein FliH